MRKRVLIYTVISLFLVGGMILVLQIVHDTKHKQIEHTQKLLLQEAKGHFNNIKNLEIWHNKFGGIFQKESDSESYNFNIYSLNPKNIENKAKGFAVVGLEYFTKHPKENYYYQFNDDKQVVLEFIGAMYTQQKCTACHTDFKVGELRGGIEVHIPTKNYTQSIEAINQEYDKFYDLIALFFIFFAIAIFYFLRKTFLFQEKISLINKSLELKVEERTREVSSLYSREHYLKNLLETITNVHESLITTYSVGAIIETSLSNFQNHPNYKLIIYGYYDGDIYHNQYSIGDKYNFFVKEFYDTSVLKSKDLYSTILKVIETKKWALHESIDTSHFNQKHIRDDDYVLRSAVSFPLIDDEQSGKFSIMTIFTDRVEGFDREELSLLDSTSNDITMALSAYKQRKMVDSLTQQQLSNYEETILAFVNMIEQRDAYTAGHTLRVAKYSRLLAQELEIEDEKIRTIERAAILHDIGKIATPDTILLKPGKLTKLEYDLIKNHVTAGYKMLSNIKMYADLAEIMKYHHEHYDGTGYPYGIKGEAIPIEAHIMIVADAFDAMTSNRIYKARLSVEDAISEIERCSGTHFHPSITAITRKVLSPLEIASTSQLPQNELEKQRFSYFFNDNLTGLYNEAYMDLVINQHDVYNSIFIFKIKNFTKFNKKFSWQKGNEVLQSIASELKIIFAKEKIFRVNGDDFVVLSKQDIEINKVDINISLIDPESVLVIKKEKLSNDKLYQLREYL